MPPSASERGTASDAGALARGIGVLIPGRLAGRATAYGVQILLARLLGPAGYGQFAIGWKILLIGGLLAALGLDNGVVRFGAAYRGDGTDRLRGLVRRTIGLSLLVGSLACGALLIASPWLADTVYRAPELRPVLLVFALGLAFVPALRVGAAATRVWQDMRYSVLAEDLAQPIAQLALVVAFHWLGMQVVGAAAAAVLSFALALALVLRYLGRLLPGPPAAGGGPAVPTREIVAFSFPTSLAGTLSLAAMWVDLLLVGYFRTQAETGIYMAASQISFLFAVVLTSFNAVFAPMIADLHHRGERRRLNELFRTSTRWGLLISVPLFVVLAIDPGGILTLLMGPRYVAGAAPMVILAAGQMINLATGAVGFLLVMSGRQNWWLAASAGALALNVALNLVLIPRFGLVGAATATTISLAGLFGSGLLMVRLAMRLWPYDRGFLRLLLAAATAALAVALPGWLGMAPSMGRTVLELALAAGVFWPAVEIGNRDDGISGLLAAIKRRD
ncbi:MAG: flippase [Acidobacteriota bacterium]|nr:flippase [Acidobacteriota bacterium]